MMTGGGGVVLAVIGTFLLASGTGPFVLGLLALIIGVGLVVHLLLRRTEASTERSSAAAAGPSLGAGLAGLFDFSGLKGMTGTNQWVAGGMSGVLSLVGLFLYSRATDGMFGLFGAILFFFGLAVVIVLVHQATDYSHEHHTKHDDETPSDQGPAAA